MWAAVIQMCSTPDLERNVAQARELVTEAAHHGAYLAALPEHFAYVGPENLQPPSAQPLDGELVSGFRELARTLGIFVLLGSFPEISHPGRPPYNTSALLGPGGELLARYRKIHLFDVDLADGPRFQESRHVQAGAEVVSVFLPKTPFTAGLSICYDLRFPELYRALADQGAHLFFVPAAFTRQTGRDHWEVLLRARAIENLAYVLAPAQYGVHAPGRSSHGRALIIDPWGTVLAQAPDGEGIIYAKLDFPRLTALRRQLPCLQHRRLR
ncbi:MAG: carbon-nitrogen hydrolase family protein [Deltaproteobacteria bacterium]|nr:carbon-nitrogen hydrolase family protein [Deltaproteobacteria bacterium]